MQKVKGHTVRFGDLAIASFSTALGPVVFPVNFNF